MVPCHNCGEVDDAINVLVCSVQVSDVETGVTVLQLFLVHFKVAIIAAQHFTSGSFRELSLGPECKQGTSACINQLSAP